MRRSGRPSPWRFAPVPLPKTWERDGSSLRSRLVRRGEDSGARLQPPAQAPAALRLVARHRPSATQRPGVRESGLRVVVAANSFAPLPRAGLFLPALLFGLLALVSPLRAQFPGEVAGTVRDAA